MIITNSEEMKGFPLVIRSDGKKMDASALASWLVDSNDEMHALLNQFGALLFRDFDVGSAVDFEKVCRAGTPDLLDYTGGGSPRSVVAGKVYTSTEYSADQTIPLHCEESYFSEPPRFIWFYCEFMRGEAGETPIGDMRRLLDNLHSRIVERFRLRGIRYIYNLHGGDGFGRGWKEAFLTENRAQVEAWLSEHGADYQWKNDGSLHMDLVGPGLRTHSETGVLVWGNQAVNWHAASLPGNMSANLHSVYRSEALFPKHATFADGGSISNEDVYEILAQLKAAEVTFPWRRQDILLCDNQCVAHGRRPFKGDRRVLVALA